MLHLSKFKITGLVLLAGLTTLISGCPVCACTPPWDGNVVPFSVDSGTLALWHFNEGTGQAALDESSNSNDLVLGDNNTTESIDPAWDVTGRFDQSLAFNATGQYAYHPIIMNAFPGNQLTVEFWVKINTSGIAQNIITTNNTIFSFQADNNNFAVFTLSGGGAPYSVTGTSNIADGNWHYIAGVYNGATSTGTLYVDGQFQVQNTSIIITLPDPTAYYIGTPSGGITGNVDEVRISNIARSSNEIFNYFNPY